MKASKAFPIRFCFFFLILTSFSLSFHKRYILYSFYCFIANYKIYSLKQHLFIYSQFCRSEVWAQDQLGSLLRITFLKSRYQWGLWSHLRLIQIVTGGGSCFLVGCQRPPLEGIAFLWNWNENGPFSVLWPLLSFLNVLACWVQHFHSLTFQDLK